MRYLFASLIAITTLVSLSAAPIPKEKAKSNDVEAIQGNWQLEKLDMGGSASPIDIGHTGSNSMTAS